LLLISVYGTKISQMEGIKIKEERVRL